MAPCGGRGGNASIDGVSSGRCRIRSVATAGPDPSSGGAGEEIVGDGGRGGGGGKDAIAVDVDGFAEGGFNTSTAGSALAARSRGNSESEETAKRWRGFAWECLWAWLGLDA